MSSQNDNHLRAAAEINRYDVSVNFFCDRCSDSDRFCIIIKNSFFRLKCSECVRVKKPCVNMSWSSLNSTREDLSIKIAADEKKLTTMITRLLRNKKILKEIDAKAKRKAQCLLSKMNEADVSMSNNCSAVNALYDLFPAIWSSFVLLNDLSNVDEIAEKASCNPSDS